MKGYWWGYARSSVLLLVGSLFSVVHAQDLSLTSDGKVPGKPFEAIQQQLNDIRARLSALESLTGGLSGLAAALAAEAAARQAADTALQNNINAEAGARAAADVSLQISINNEAAARAVADTTLLNNTDAEIQARIAGDASTLAAAKAYTDSHIPAQSGSPMPFVFVGDIIAQGETRYVVPDRSSPFVSTTYNTGYAGTFVSMVTQTHTYSGSQTAQPETYTLLVNSSPTALSCSGRSCVSNDPVHIGAGSTIQVRVEVPLTDTCASTGNGCAGITPVITLYFRPD